MLVKVILIFGLASLFLTTTDICRAQLAPPNAAGVTMGHVSLNVRDVEASRKFFMRFGGTPVRWGNTVGIKYPGAFLFLVKAEPSGGMEGSAVDHIGFRMKNGVAFFTKLKDEGVKTTTNGVNDQGQIYGGYIYSPDGVKIEIIDPDALGFGRKPAGLLQFDQIHYFLAEPGPRGGTAWSELQSWYTEVFGASATFTTLKDPGPGNTDSPQISQSVIAETSLRFSPWRSSAPTKGRAMDHIGFEVKNLEAFCQQLQAKGIKLDVPYRSESGVGTAYLTDPAGTYIALTEGLNLL